MIVSLKDDQRCVLSNDDSLVNMGVVDVAQPVDVLVAGGGGFIGGHLVADLLNQGLSVRSVDVKPPIGVVPSA